MNIHQQSDYLGALRVSTLYDYDYDPPHVPQSGESEKFTPQAT